MIRIHSKSTDFTQNLTKIEKNFQCAVGLRCGWEKNGKTENLAEIKNLAEITVVSIKKNTVPLIRLSGEY